MIREAPGDGVAAHPLAFEVDLRHEIDLAFLLDTESRLPALCLDLSRMEDDFDSGCEERVTQDATS